MAITVSLGATLFGYDTPGFIGPVTSMQSFKDDFGINASNTSAVSGNVVSTLQAGCFFGTIFMACVSDRVGRRMSLVICGIIFDIGAILQMTSKGKLGLLYGGRVISGLAVGAASMITPTYLNEMAPKVRGTMSMLYGVSLFFSITLAYWIDYACHATLSGSNQWRVPTAIQLVSGSILILGMIPLKESPRWLVKRDRRDEAYSNLIHIRRGSATEEEVRQEFEEIVLGYEAELAVTQGRSFKECYLSENRYRLFLLFLSWCVSSCLVLCRSRITRLRSLNLLVSRAIVPVYLRLVCTVS